MFAASLGELPFFNFCSKTSECYTFKGPCFQKQIQGAKHKNRFFWKNVFFTVLPILYLRKLILYKNLFDTFLFSKKGTFPQKSVAQLSLLKISFWRFTLESSST